MFVAAAAVGGMGVGAYALAWLLMPARTIGPAPAERLRERPGSGRTAVGVALLTLSGLLALRQLGVLFSDAIVWPVVLAAAGVALVWRLSTPAVDEAAVDARPEVAERAQRRWATIGLYRGGFGVALILGAALLFMYASGLLVGLRNVALTAVVVTAGLVLILAPLVDRGAHGAPRWSRRGARRPGSRHRDRADAGAVAMTPQEPPSVVIVDDHDLFRAGVRAELEGAVRVLGDAGTVEDAETAILATEPDVVLLDVHMPGGGGVEVIRRVALRRPAQRFLALSVSDTPEDVIAVIRAGARGYVTKTISGPDLADAVSRVRDGDAVFSPRLAA